MDEATARQTEFLQKTVPVPVAEPADDIVQTAENVPSTEIDQGATNQISTDQVTTVQTESAAETVPVTNTVDDFRGFLSVIPTAEAKRRQAELMKQLERNQQIIALKDKHDDQMLRKKFAGAGGDLTDYHLAKSLAVGKKYDDIRQRYAAKMGAPINERTDDRTDGEKFPALFAYQNPDLLEPHEHKLTEEPYSVMDEPISAVEQSPLLKYVPRKPHLEPLKAAFDEADAEYDRKVEKFKDQLYKRNQPVDISSEEEVIPITEDLLLDEKSSPKRAYHLKTGPGLLDESFEEEELLDPPLVREPENYVADKGLMDDEQMEYDDVFGDNEIVDPRIAFKTDNLSSESSLSDHVQSESRIASRKAYEAIDDLRLKLAAIRPLAIHDENIVDRIQEFEDHIRALEVIASKHAPPKKPKKQLTPLKIPPTPVLDAAGRIRPALALSPTSRTRLLKGLTDEDYIELDRRKKEAGIIRLPLTMSPATRIRKMYEQAPRYKHKRTTVDPNTGRMSIVFDYVEKPPPTETDPEPETLLNDEELELVSSDDGEIDKDNVVMHSPPARPLYIPSSSSSSSSSATEMDNVPSSFHTVHLPDSNVPSTSRGAAAYLPDTSPIGKTWIDRNERGFAWLQEMVPMVSGPYIRRRRVLQFNTEPVDESPAIVSDQRPTQVPPEKKKKSVRTTCELLDSTLTEVIFISPRPNRPVGAPKKLPLIKPPKPYRLTEPEVFERSRQRAEAKALARAQQQDEYY